MGEIAIIAFSKQRAKDEVLSDDTDTARTATNEPDPDEASNALTMKSRLRRRGMWDRTDGTNYARFPTTTVSLPKQPRRLRARSRNDFDRSAMPPYENAPLPHTKRKAKRLPHHTQRTRQFKQRPQRAELCHPYTAQLATGQTRRLRPHMHQARDELHEHNRRRKRRNQRNAVNTVKFRSDEVNPTAHTQ